MVGFNSTWLPRNQDTIAAFLAFNDMLDSCVTHVLTGEKVKKRGGEGVIALVNLQHGWGKFMQLETLNTMYPGGIQCMYWYMYWYEVVLHVCTNNIEETQEKTKKHTTYSPQDQHN